MVTNDWILIITTNVIERSSTFNALIHKEIKAGNL